MKKMRYQNVKGTEDFLPEREFIRRKVRRTLEDVFIQYGYQPLETPILNYTSLLASKYGGGAEILEEMYQLSDRGERDLALRYDLTVPFTKVIALNPAIRMPFKRYEIGKVFRDGPIKKGRLREFTQCDVDCVGVSSQMAEAELMTMSQDACTRLGLDVTIQYNNRKLLTGILLSFSIKPEETSAVILTLDKLEKIGVKAVADELLEKGLPAASVVQITEFLTAADKRTPKSLAAFTETNELIREGLAELDELQSYLSYLSLDTTCLFNPFLARGLDFYTNTVYEIFLNKNTFTSSLGSGGRYDQAIAGLMEADQAFGTIGISFGLDAIFAALDLQTKPVKGETDICIIPLQTEKQSLLLAQDLRKQGLSVELNMKPSKLSKALDRANKDNIPRVIVLGEAEVQQNAYTIKTMATGEEERVVYDFRRE
ncbi:histidyl-tRNA synthetase [Alkalihalobacillus xiaoxiensis]|uniref:Histidine--tRNA ligase n=2 Tax=Shouchella xiaoxiensis TaxID=766895 RepID=A0ABS2SWR4_9BACI|nr:histidine--tRNA ligase [Shouchella xiaoxiensis]MBM7839675.1 histidyl-tRNA synthetase [Shouchella xiaoxiensis]